MGRKKCFKVEATRDKHHSNTNTSLLNFFVRGPITPALVPTSIVPELQPSIAQPAVKPENAHH